MKNIVITGAGSGIGLALAKQYLSKGYQVYATKLHHQEVSLNTASIVFIDVNFLEDTSNEWMNQLPDTIDVFIANAGVASYEKNTLPEMNDAMYVLNTLTPIRQFERLKHHAFKGTFVVMGSVMAFWPLPGYARYSHTKSALVTYFKALQMTETIDIVILMPVAMQTEFFKQARQPHSPLMSQKPEKVSKKMVRIIAKKREVWISSRFFALIYKLSPKLLSFYQKREAKIYRDNFNKFK